MGMFLEKGNALQETGLAMSQAPMRFWLDAMSTNMVTNPLQACTQAMISGSYRMSRPSSNRVLANQKRLLRGSST